ncbi:carbohydrate ABC transporter permease [Oceaniglobus trochenteri]|uniref:carbohydrate ABC transporter permease n=1 Tax=Oceaniglobus trochenteri TaxID=2763260 RepID=UPI001CFF8260|nr:carbohydrate ABC transporter permease [Oceaniglobus trochenteri]
MKTRSVKDRSVALLAWVFMAGVTFLFLYPFWWMIVSSFRSQEAMLLEPTRLLPESFNTRAYGDIQTLGGVKLWLYTFNSVFITVAATLIAVGVTALGAYALYRKPDLPGFRFIQFGFLMTMMYPAMLLVIPVYLVVFQLGLLGTYAGIILFLSLMPILFLMLVQFFRSIPKELIESAKMDGASEMQIFRKIVLPISKPILATVFLIGFLLNWKQWLPILVIATSPDQYTLPVALLSMNTELGIDFQATMALAAITTVPIIVLFLFTQRRVIGGFVAGAVKG